MRHLSHIVTYIIPLVLFAQFGRESEQNHTKPAVNFHGIVIDNADKTLTVDNITIDKLYKQIPFYVKPTDPLQDPLKNIARIDLQEVEEIRPAYPNNPKEGILKYANRDYIQVVIVTKGEKHIENTYLIETARKLFFDEMQNGYPVERELSFEALKKLTLTSYESRDTEKKSKEEVKTSKDRKDLQCAQAGKTLGELSQKTEQLQDPEKGVFSQLINKVKDLVGSICSAS